MKVYDRQYDSGVKGQGNIFKICPSTPERNTSSIFSTKGVKIWHNDCLLSLDFNKGSRLPI